MTEIKTTYNYNEYEEKWLKFWSDNRLFYANAYSDKPTYSIIMPPPNVTDKLHLGHALNNSLQDILIRWKRMQGFEVCWLPGTDHAGIATQMMVERSLAQKNVTKEQLGREAFTQKCREWKDEYGGIIIKQLKRLGFSADWSRESYTMNVGLSKAVRHIFVELYKEGLIYRGERLVNWDCILKTAVSDDEVESKEVNGNLWFFRYPLVGRPGEFISFATTRPETMLGDVALAVHPEDERYRHLIGTKAALPFVDREIPIVADDYVKPEFGTGCVKITPAHDVNDFELGKRHHLPMLNILNIDGTIANDQPAPFAGLDRFVARKEIIKKMKELDLFDKEQAYKTALPHSERSKTVIEPRLSKQWYVKMKELVEPAIAVAKNDELHFFPNMWKKTYLHWTENIQDWCISRQLWWGHRIPIWYCRDCNKITCTMEDPDLCEHCQSKNIFQDDDVLDTWFSSWLWPISPFGWPEATADLQKFYPSQVLITAAEIIFLWVARMVMVGLKTMGKPPFKDIFFNAIICDKEGRKFSKTLGNGIDPLEVIDLYGADAVRFTCVAQASVGGRVRMEKGEFETGARFINKLWNASRFLLSNLDPTEKLLPLKDCRLDLPSQWLLSRFFDVTQEFNKHMDHYRIFEATNTLYHFIWGDVCDWSLECAKDAFYSKDTSRLASTRSALVYVFDGLLRLASPIMPFITEEIWHKLPSHPDWDHPKSLMIAKFPDASNLQGLINKKAQESWDMVMSLISEFRSVKAQAQLAKTLNHTIYVVTSPENGQVISASLSWIKRLTYLETVDLLDQQPPEAKCLVGVGKGFEIFLPVDENFDTEGEVKRLLLEEKRLANLLTSVEKKLGNAEFVAKAPEEVIKDAEEKKQLFSTQLKAIKANLFGLKKG